MAGRLVWDKVGERFYETGIKNMVLYPGYDSETEEYGNGVAWNGISGVTEKPSGAEANAIYADDMKYLNLYSAEELGLTIEGYMSPAEFDECDGSAELDGIKGVTVGQQERKVFGICYRTTIGNDTDGNAKGYKLHFVYGCKASPSEHAYTTINDSPEAASLSWEVTTTPIKFEDKSGKEISTSIVTVDSTLVSAEKMKALENYCYGAESTEAKLPSPKKIAELLGAAG